MVKPFTPQTLPLQSLDWEQWIEFFLRAVTEQSRINADKAQAIIDLKEETLLRVQEVTHSQYTLQVVNYIFSKPWFTGTDFRAGADVPRTSVTRLLNRLTKGGIITKIISGKRRKPSLYMFPTLKQIVE